MQLQPLYDMKERLESAAIAGVSLLSDDFRLKRALDAFAPLAAASPVFAKINAGVAKLLAALADQRSGLLLDVLALVDAVYYTQGVTDLPGEWEPLPHTGAGTYCTASYGQLHPLLDALTSTGSGRLEVVDRNWENHPEFFSDFRVLPFVIRALGDNYAELAEKITVILQSMGEAVLPLLEEGFNPAGNQDMVRRVRVIEAIAGSKANAFYCAMLENPESTDALADAPATRNKAKGNVKQALIYALRHDAGNIDRILTLCHTERGTANKMAHYTLAQLDVPKAWDYWETLVTKKPKKVVDVIQYMTDASSVKAGEWINRLLLEQLAPLVADPKRPVEEDRDKAIAFLLYALANKPGETVAESVRQAATLGTVKDWKVLMQHVTMFDSYAVHDSYFGNVSSMSFRQAFPLFLQRALLAHPDEAWLQLAMELYEQYGEPYLTLAMTAQLLTQRDSAACYEWAAAQFPSSDESDPPEQAANPDEPDKPAPSGTAGKSGKPGKEKKQNRKLEYYKEACQHTLGKLVWNTQSHNYEFQLPYTSVYIYAASAPSQPIVHPLAAPLDLRWFSLLTRMPVDELIGRLLYCRVANEPNDPALLEIVGPYLYQQLVKPNSTTYAETRLFHLLIYMGWRDWKGLLRRQAEAIHTLDYYHILYRLKEMPLTNAEKAAELRELDQLALHAQEHKLKILRSTWNRKVIAETIEEWEHPTPDPEEPIPLPAAADATATAATDLTDPTAAPTLLTTIPS